MLVGINAGTRYAFSFHRPTATNFDSIIFQRPWCVVRCYLLRHIKLVNSPSFTLGFSVSKSPTPPPSVATMASFDRLGQFPQGSSVTISPALVSGLDQMRDGRLNKVKKKHPLRIKNFFFFYDPSLRQQT